MDRIYKYNRIDLAKDAIRLIRLLRGYQGEPIECEIFETYLHQVEGVPYEALSYVWGTGQSEDWIWVDGCRFRVTENLYEVLVHLRRPGEDRVLWIDAICINQSHNAVSEYMLHQYNSTNTKGSTTYNFSNTCWWIRDDSWNLSQIFNCKEFPSSLTGNANDRGHAGTWPPGWSDAPRVSECSKGYSLART